MVGRYILQWTVSRVLDLKNLWSTPAPQPSGGRGAEGALAPSVLSTRTCSSRSGGSPGAATGTCPTASRPPKPAGAGACGQGRPFRLSALPSPGVSFVGV